MAIGYDDRPFDVGDQVMLHPGLEVARRGLKLGVVEEIEDANTVRVNVEGRSEPLTGHGRSFRRIDG